MNILKKGSKGLEVVEVLKLLVKCGYTVTTDGIFGSITLEAVKKFQKAHNLTTDGIVGEKTLNALKKYSNGILTKRKINDLILHCSATLEGKDYTVKDIDKWHKDRGFNKIGYHYVIYRDGSIHTGRNESEIGAHCTNHNSYSIGICYIGGLKASSTSAKDTRTSEQKEAMYKLVKDLLTKYNLTLNNVHCHNLYANKACPSFNITQFKKEFNNYYGN